MKKFKVSALLASILLLAGCNNINPNNGGANIIDYEVNKEVGNDPFDYPGNYIEPELKVDGVKDEAEWQQASPIVTYGLLGQASMQLYRGETALYAFFDVKDNDLQSVGNSNGDDVTHSDSIEVYFDFRNDAASKPQTDDIQINISVNGRTRIFIGTGDGWGTWNGLLDFEVKLDGTLNSEIPLAEPDNGYSVEIMIPYTQVGIEKDSTFGVSVGVVARGLESTHESLEYTWSGITLDGSFIDPQKPSGYFVYMGNEFYTKDKVPMENISVEGYVYNQKKEVVSNATVEIDGKHVTTDANGKYLVTNVNPNSAQELSVSKDGFKTYATTISQDALRAATASKYNQDVVIIDENITFKTTVSGVVKNPAQGVMANATVEIDGTTLTTNANGEFTKEVVVDGSKEVKVSMKPYKDSLYTIDALALAGQTAYDAGIIPLYSPSSTFSFGGQRGVTLVNGEVYRGFEGINFKFSSDKELTNGDTVQLFIDSQHTIMGRDDSDYRIDFNGAGEVYIVNFGDGDNVSVARSGIKNNAYLQGTTYYMETFIPYEFLGVDFDDVIGFSCGSFKATPEDWDGFSFAQEGFAEYVAPEYATEYVRVGLDNGLYRALSNDVVAKKVYGQVVDANGNALTNAFVNNVPVDANGYYTVYVLEGNTTNLSVTCNGYLSQTLTVDLVDNSEVSKDIVMSQSNATVIITVKDSSGTPVAGASVTVKEYPDITATTDANGQCTIVVSTANHINIVVSKDGYTTTTSVVSKVMLGNSANNNTPYNKAITLKAA